MGVEFEDPTDAPIDDRVERELQEAQEKINELNRFKEMLKHGYVVIKYTVGRSGKPKQLRRFIWLDASGTRLCLSQSVKNASKCKGIDVGDVVEVRDGSATNTFERCRPEMESRCFSIIGDERTFDLEIPPEIPNGSHDRDMFVDNLRLLVLYRVLEGVTGREVRAEKKRNQLKMLELEERYMREERANRRRERATHQKKKDIDLRNQYHVGYRRGFSSGGGVSDFVQDAV